MEMTTDNYRISMHDIITSCLAEAEIDSICATEAIDKRTRAYHMDRLCFTHYTLNHIIREHVNPIYAPAVYSESKAAARQIRKLIEDCMREEY